MPKAEEYAGIINLLADSLNLMEDGEAKKLVTRARSEIVRLANHPVTTISHCPVCGVRIDLDIPGHNQGRP